MKSSRTAPQPHWIVLYVTLALIGAAGTVADRLARGSAGLLRDVNVAFAVAVLVTLAGWVRGNRVALVLEERRDG
jgi:hypothetical protein